MDSKQVVPRTSEFLKKVGLPHNARPIAAQFLQLCAALWTMVGVEDCCYKALTALAEQPLSPSDLGKRLGIRARCVEMFCDHLVEAHGIVRGDAEMGFTWNVKYPRGYIDRLVALFPITELRKIGLDTVKGVSENFCDQFRISRRNVVFVAQALVQLWVIANVPGAEAAELSGDVRFFVVTVYEWIRFLLDYVYMDDNVFLWFVRWHVIYPLLFVGGVFFDIVVFLLVNWQIIWFFLRFGVTWYFFVWVYTTLHRRTLAWWHRRSLRKRQRDVLRGRAKDFIDFLEVIRTSDAPRVVKRNMWISEGYSGHDFDTLIPDEDGLIPECSNPIALAPDLPHGTMVEFYVNDGEKRRVGTGGVLKIGGTRCTVVTSGHVLPVWIKHVRRSIRFRTWEGEQLVDQDIDDPICTNVTPGSQYGCASVCVDAPSGPIRAFVLGVVDLSKPVFYWRRGVPLKVVHPTICADRLVYKGDTIPGDSGSILYQGKAFVAMHQGTWSEVDKLNFASLGCDVKCDITGMHDGYAEAPPTGMAKEPKHAKGYAPKQYLLKAAKYDGNQFGELLDTAPWTALWDFKEDQHQFLLIVDQVWYLSAHLLFWKWSDWKRAGSPRHFDEKIFNSILKEEIMPYLKGKSWDGKVRARLARLIGRRIYPVPEEDGANSTYGVGKDILDLYPRNGPRPTLREILHIRYYAEHAMKMNANEWGKIRGLVQEKVVKRRALVWDEAVGKKVFKEVEQRVERTLADKVPRISSMITRDQFYDKNFALNLYAAALENGLITREQIPSILGQFGSREVEQWIKSKDDAAKEWYLHYASGLTELYGEGEELDYDPVSELEDEGVVGTLDSDGKVEVDMAKLLTPQLFRDKHATSEEAITIQRFAELEDKVRKLEFKLQELLGKTDYVSTDVPEIKAGLIDVATELAKATTKAVGKTIAENSGLVKVAKITPVIDCECGMVLPEPNYETHRAGRKHARLMARKTIDSEVGGALPPLPPQLVPESGHVTEGLYCQPCNRLFTGDRVDHDQSYSHILNVVKKSRSGSFLGEKSAGNRGRVVSSTVSQTPVAKTKYVPPQRRTGYRNGRNNGWRRTQVDPDPSIGHRLKQD